MAGYRSFVIAPSAPFSDRWHESSMLQRSVRDAVGDNTFD